MSFYQRIIAWFGARRPLRINLLVPEPHPGAGGDMTLFRVARHLAEFGHDVRVYVVPYVFMNDYTNDDVRVYMRKHFPPTDAVYEKWSGAVRDADCTIATFWPTVENVLGQPNGGRRFYIVQDFEPWFYPDVPFHRDRAEETYRAGLHCITVGRWLARFLRENYGTTADYFDFGVERKIYHPRRRADRRRRVCFYARPSTPRRGYGIGLQALAQVKARHPEFEIVFFGSDSLDPAPEFELINRGVLEPNAMADLFASCDLGVVISLTNPSLVPLEMLACGCPVVEIASERWEGMLQHGVNAWLVEPNADAIAAGVLHLLGDKKLRGKLSANGIAGTRKMDWRNSVRQIEAILRRDIAAA